MRQSISTQFGILVALMLVVLPLFGGAPAVFAQGDGLQDDHSYESPQFGYSVTWGDEWSVRAGDVRSDRGGYDEITLRGDDGTLWIQGEAEGVTPAEAVESRISLEGSEDDVVAQDLDADVPMTEMLVGRDKVLIEGYTLEGNDAVVVVVLSARERDFENALASVHEQVLLNGGQILTGEEVTEGRDDASVQQETEEPTEEESEELTQGDGDESETLTSVDGSYTGQLYNYTLEFDEDLWEVTEEIDSDESDGLHLLNETGALTIWTWNAYGHDPVACLDGEATYYGTEDSTVEDWMPAEDANGDPIRRESRDYAYGVFTLTYLDPEEDEPTELVDYIECRSIPGEDATLIILGSSTPEQYNDHLDAMLDVADTITFEGGETQVAEEPVEEPVETDTPETGLSGSLFTSPSFGFTFDIPSQWRIEDERLSPSDERLMLSNGTSDVMIWATDEYSGDLAGYVDFAAEAAPFDLELAETAQGTPFRGDDRNGAYGNFLYDNGDEAYFISCQYIEEGESVLVVTQDVPAEDLASERKFRIDLQDAIELP